LQVFRRLALHARRDFLGEEFKQQIRHGNAYPSRSLKTCLTAKGKSGGRSFRRARPG
jgi:hypothetical protein